MNQFMFTGMFTNMLTYYYLFTYLSTCLFTPLFTYFYMYVYTIVYNYVCMYSYNHPKGNYEAYECYLGLPMLIMFAYFTCMLKPMFPTTFTSMIKKMFTRMIVRLLHKHMFTGKYDYMFRYDVM